MPGLIEVYELLSALYVLLARLPRRGEMINLLRNHQPTVAQSAITLAEGWDPESCSYWSEAKDKSFCFCVLLIYSQHDYMQQKNGTYR